MASLLLSPAPRGLSYPSPVEGPGQVVPGAQREDGDGRRRPQLQLVQHGQDPAHLTHTHVSFRQQASVPLAPPPAEQWTHRPIAAARQDPQVGNFGVQLQPGDDKQHRKPSAGTLQESTT